MFHEQNFKRVFPKLQNAKLFISSLLKELTKTSKLHRCMRYLYQIWCAGRSRPSVVPAEYAKYMTYCFTDIWAEQMQTISNASTQYCHNVLIFTPRALRIEDEYNWRPTNDRPATHSTDPFHLVLGVVFRRRRIDGAISVSAMGHSPDPRHVYF